MKKMRAEITTTTLYSAVINESHLEIFFHDYSQSDCVSERAKRFLFVRESDFDIKIQQTLFCVQKFLPPSQKEYSKMLFALLEGERNLKDRKNRFLTFLM